VFLINEGVLPAHVRRSPRSHHRVDPECYVRLGPRAGALGPPARSGPGAVLRPDGPKVAVGLARRRAIYLNLEFLDGTRGGHVSISGISGVATKTSFALFLLYSIFRGGVLAIAR